MVIYNVYSCQGQWLYGRHVFISTTMQTLFSYSVSINKYLLTNTLPSFQAGSISRNLNMDSILKREINS